MEQLYSFGRLTIRSKYTWLRVAVMVTMKRGDSRSYLLLSLRPARSRSDSFECVKSEWDCKRALASTKGTKIKK